MQPGQPNVYGLNCGRCGSALELPADLNALACDCPFCGLDNVLPEHLIRARRQQYQELERQRELDAKRQRTEQMIAEQAKARQQGSRTVLYFMGGLAVLAMMFIGSCVAFFTYANRKTDEAIRRRGDPTINGRNVVLDEIARLRKKKGCDRMLVEPDDLRDKVSLDMVAGGPCVHVVAATGTGARIMMSLAAEYRTEPLPDPATRIDYRLCAHQSGTHTVEFNANHEPFTVAAIECPRLPGEKTGKKK